MNNSNSVAGSAQGQAESETQNSTLQHGSDGSSIGSATTHDTATHLLNKPLVPGPQESYSPWDMPPIIQPATSNADTRLSAGCKGFSTNLTTWPHFRSKPHPTISVPATPTTLAGRSNFDMAAPSTPPHSSFSNPDDSDNAMVTPTFGSSNSGYSRRNSAISVMALDTPPPLSLMDLESSSASSLSGSSFGSSGLGHGLPGPSMRPGESVFHGHGYPFPLFGMRNDVHHSISRRSSRTNSVSMESRHVRKPSEDTNMSDGGNNSGSERSRRHSPAVVPFERSVRRSALLPKPKGLLKVFTQLEEEAHHNRHEYDHERETTQVRKGATEDPDVTLMDAGVGSGRRSPFPLEPSVSRRPSSSRLNPDQELCNFQRQQEEYDKIYQMQQLQHLAQLQEQQQLERHQQTHPHPLQATVHLEQHEAQPSTSFMNHHHNNASMMSSPSSPLLAPMVTRSSKRKSSTCEERFEPYNSSQLKRRAVSPSLGPIISHRRSPSSSPARSHLGHPKSKQAMMGPLSSPSGHGSIFRHHGSNLSIGSGISQEVDSTNQSGASESEGSGHGEGVAGVHSVGLGNAPRISSSLNLQHTSRSFSELSLNHTQ